MNLYSMKKSTRFQRTADVSISGLIDHYCNMMINNNQHLTKYHKNAVVLK